MTSRKHSRHEIDLDEDLFGFDEVEEVVASEQEEEELRSAFAAFQAIRDDEDPRREPRARSEERRIRSSEPSRPSRSPHEPPKPLRRAATKTTPRPAPRVVRGGPSFSKAGFLILFSMTTLNALVAFVMLKNAAAMRDSALEIEQRVSATAQDILQDSYESSLELLSARRPLVQSDPNTHPVFDRAKELIGEGGYVEARQQLYSLLAVVDRLEPSRRRQVEARAHFLLAEATHLETLSRLEDPR